MIDSRSDLLTQAVAQFNRRNLPQAEALCRYLMSQGVEHPQLYYLLAAIAQSVGKPDFARDHLLRVLALAPNFADAKRALISVERRLRDPPPDDASGRRYLLIRAWGCGFWADVDHVLGQLLLAEITGRTPIVHWGIESLYRDEDVYNAFEIFFEPVSDVRMDVLQAPGHRYFPPKWHASNLDGPCPNKWEGPWSRMAALYYLARPETVAVSDFHTYVADLAPWIPPGHALHGLSPRALYRFLVRKYLRPPQSFHDEVENLWSRDFAGRKLVAVHARGGDKVHEFSDLPVHLTAQHEHVAALLDSGTVDSVFLMTDRNPIVTEYRARYGDRVVALPAIRSDRPDTGLHHEAHRERTRLGFEVMRDVYLAARCSRFVGLGYSTVSTAVTHLRDGGPEECLLLGDDFLCEPHLVLHNR